MDNPHNTVPAAQGFETRDANVGGVFTFLVVLAIVIIVAGLVCWGMFHYFSANEMNQPATESPFSGERQLPLGPRLQVEPREDWLKFREEQQKSLETFEWVNRSAGTARVPIEDAMQLLVKKGVPVQGQSPAPAPAPGTDAKKPAAEGNPKP